MWNGYSNKFHYNRFRHLTNLKVNLTILEADWGWGGGLMKYATEIFSCGMIYILSFRRTGTGVQGFASAILDAIMLVLMMRGMYEVGH
jgi:hypothetical protein